MECISNSLKECIKKYKYGEILENTIKESLIYCKPILKLKYPITSESIGKKLIWRGVNNVIVNSNKNLFFVTQRNIIISRFILSDGLKIFSSKIDHEFFGKDWRGDNLIKIKDYLGMR